MSVPRAVRVVRSVALVLVVAALPACGDADALEREAAMRSELLAEIEKTRKEAERSSKALEATRDEVRNLRDTVADLGRRVAELETRPASASPMTPTEIAAAGGAAKEPSREALLAEMKALQDKVMNGEATDKEEERFWELARTTKVLDEMLKTLEGKVKANPDDLEARMNLASGYVSKLMTVPNGMEQGMWSMRAETQWREVLKRDPDHWDARFSIAYGWTFWPEQFNKTPDAIKEFETLREVQERQTVDSRHAQTYLQLSRLYQRQGKTDKAKELLRTGLARHPNDAELTKALASLED